MGVLYAKVGGAWEPILGGSNGGGGVLLTPVRRFYTSADTWVPPGNLIYAVAEATGAGGGGGGAAVTGAGVVALGGGGAGGGYSMSTLMAASLPASVPITIGTGGAGGGGGGNGVAGGASSFGSLVIANGGPGGSFSAVSAVPNNAAGGNAPALGTGDTVVGGTDGGHGLTESNANQGMSGGGGDGSGPYGGGGGRAVHSLGPGRSGQQYGGGGSGAINNASQAAKIGGIGAGGCVAVTEYVQSDAPALVGWEPIGNAALSASAGFSVSIPASTYEMVRIHLMGTTSVTTAVVGRVNNNAAAGSHRYITTFLDGVPATGGAVVPTTTYWNLGSITGTGFTNIITTIWATSAGGSYTAQLSYQSLATSYNATGNAAINRITGGSTVGNELLSSFFIFPVSGTFTGRYICEGYRV